MKVGLIARAEDRGLGVMTWAFHRHMRPAKTMVIAPTPNIARGFPQHHDRYEGDHVTTAAWGGGELPEAHVRDFLDGLDVAYTAETFYDPRIPLWADEQNVATVQHVMPEFYNPALPQPTAVWLPTGWRACHMPMSSFVVPVPVEHALAPRPVGQPVRFLHVVGHRAMADRNGTTTTLQALRRVHVPIHATIVSQDQRLPASRTHPAVKLRRVLGGVADLGALYDDADVVVIPRRYGGLCLPAQEAMSHGCALAMPAVEPNTDWPIIGVPASHRGTIATVAGEIPLAHVEPVALTRLFVDLATDPEVVAEQQRRSYDWARAHTWEALKSDYEQALADAVARRHRP